MAHNITQLHVGDEDALLTLFGELLPGFVLLDAGGPTLFLSDPASFVFGAYVGDAPAGLAWGVQIRYPTGRLVTYLHELDVHEKFRRQHIATSLIEESMALARLRGSTRFWLTTGGHNEVAQSVYASLDGVRKPLGDVNYWWDL
jgi:ribosomal protein S18 acetylase RimI-like enzyme